MSNVEIYNSQKVDPSKIWLLFLFLGWSYGSLGQMGMQILYYCTLGGCGVWTFIRFFTLSSDIKKYNRDLALRSGCNSDDLLKLNLI